MDRAIPTGTATAAIERSRVTPLPRKLAADSVFGMALFVFTEIMLFAGFISAFVIVKSSYVPGAWPPLGQPRLPMASTAVNTAALLLSGLVLYLAYRAFTRRGPRAAMAPMGLAIGLGAFFVVFQGLEWVALLRQGLTLTSSQLGAFFYLIVGAHALHATAAMVALVVYWLALRRGALRRSSFQAVMLFWYFVVLMWPVIYWQVYL
jgi:heme/copper-type cytochrome/quinol oxidase subunit 3